MTTASNQADNSAQNSVTINIDDDEIDQADNTYVQMLATPPPSSSSPSIPSPTPPSSPPPSPPITTDIEPEKEPDYIRYDEPAVCKPKSRSPKIKNKFRK